MLKVADAQTRLAELIDKALGGEDVVIAREDGKAVRLVPVEMYGVPRFGSARGLFTIAHDFDTPIDDFVRYER
ncbi:MAG TPA: hypothetical protein VEX86_27285 [Longimicrobium sp.]|nr:hypothetical protein [Longimicrobium sp.]